MEGSATSRARKQGTDIVEGSTPSKTEEPTSITSNTYIDTHNPIFEIIQEINNR
jgi:hypothetical protein